MLLLSLGQQLPKQVDELLDGHGCHHIATASERQRPDNPDIPDNPANPDIPANPDNKLKLY